MGGDGDPARPRLRAASRFGDGAPAGRFGAVAAVALVRPTKLDGLTPKSVKKKMKQPSFAAAVDRDELRQGAEELGEDFDQHVAFVIAAMQPRAEVLGLA